MGEFAFAEDPSHWSLAPLSRPALDEYKKNKFGQWKDMLLKSDCEAQLRRMLQLGVVNRVYDGIIFPTPEPLKSQSYQVIDERSGRKIDLPHPVAALRIWNPANDHYEVLDPMLFGAPLDHEKAGWWAGFVKDLKETRGEGYINGLIANRV